MTEPRCPECHMPLTMHHDIRCSQPCGACKAAIPKQKANALDRAADILNETSHSALGFTAGYWIGIRDTLREVATAYRNGTIKEVNDDLHACCHPLYGC